MYILQHDKVKSKTSSLERFIHAVLSPNGYPVAWVKDTQKSIEEPTMWNRQYKTLDDFIHDAPQLETLNTCVFFGLGTTKEWKNGKKGTRTTANMCEYKSFWFDVDVKDGDYENKDDALDAILDFIETCGLPQPWIVESGGGFHVYISLTDTYTPNQRESLIDVVYRVAVALDFKLDKPAFDKPTQVLRLPGTHNYKRHTEKTAQAAGMKKGDYVYGEPQPVDVLQEGVTDWDFKTLSTTFRKLHTDLVGDINNVVPITGKNSAPVLSASNGDLEVIVNETPKARFIDTLPPETIKLLSKGEFELLTTSGIDAIEHTNVKTQKLLKGHYLPAIPDELQYELDAANDGTETGYSEEKHIQAAQYFIKEAAKGVHNDGKNGVVIQSPFIFNDTQDFTYASTTAKQGTDGRYKAVVDSNGFHMTFMSMKTNEDGERPSKTIHFTSGLMPKEFADNLHQHELEKRRKDEERRKKNDTDADYWERIHFAAPIAPSDHPYLSAKGMRKTDSIKISNNNESLIIPFYNTNDEFRAVQFINPDGTKRFKGSYKSAYFAWGEPENGKKTFICEGVATGFTISRLLNNAPVLCAGCAENLINVAIAASKAYPDSEIVICADNDVDGAGQKAAGRAAAEVNAQLAVSTSKKGSDFNDMVVLDGLNNEAYDLLRDPQEVFPKVNKLQPMDIGMLLVPQLDEDIVCDDANGKQWYERSPNSSIWTPSTTPRIKKRIEDFLRQTGNAKTPATKVNGIVSSLEGRLSLKKWEDDMYLWAFQNGVLDVRDLSFRAFKPEERFNWCTPLEFDPDETYCDDILHFINHTSGDDEDVINTRIEAHSMALQRRYDMKRHFEFTSPESNTGKSTELGIFRQLGGGKYKATTGEFQRMKANSRFESRRFKDKWVVTLDEQTSMCGMQEQFKLLTNGGASPVIYEDKGALVNGEQEFIPHFIMAIGNNGNMPIRDQATRDRLITIVMRHRVTKAMMASHNGNLAADGSTNFNATVFNQLVGYINYLKQWKQEHQGDSYILNPRGQIARDMSIISIKDCPLTSWANDCLIREDGNGILTGRINDDPQQMLFPNYIQWCNDMNLHEKERVSQTWLVRKLRPILKKHGIELSEYKNSLGGISGFRLRNDLDHRIPKLITDGDI